VPSFLFASRARRSISDHAISFYGSPVPTIAASRDFVRFRPLVASFVRFFLRMLLALFALSLFDVFPSFYTISSLIFLLLSLSLLAARVPPPFCFL
jgi:hypothetical protein